jgi:hypothetical protein
MCTNTSKLTDFRRAFPPLVFVLAMTLSSTVRGRAQEGLTLPSAEAKLSREAIAESDARRERIKRELAKGTLADWAGDYYEGDGLGANVSLTLAPANGFVATWHGCLGLYDLNYGEVVWTDQKILLRFTYPNNPDGIGFPGELIPVRWSARHYLIPANKMIEFANAVNRKSEPRNRAWGTFLLKRGDEKKRVPGVPTLPAEYTSYVLKKPIRTTIASVGSSRVAGDESLSTRHTQIVLHAGQAEGVKEGMEFYVYGSPSDFASAKITKTEEHTSEADLEQDEVPTVSKPPAPAAGWKLSTAFEK